MTLQYLAGALISIPLSSATEYTPSKLTCQTWVKDLAQGVWRQKWPSAC